MQKRKKQKMKKETISLFEILKEGTEAVRNLRNSPSMQTALAYIAHLNRLDELTRRERVYFRKIDYDKQHPSVKITDEQNTKHIIDFVCNYTGISIDVIKSRARSLDVVTARQCIVWLVNDYMIKYSLGADFDKIGALVGVKRSNVYTTIKRVNDAIEVNDKMIISILNAYNQQKEAA